MTTPQHNSDSNAATGGPAAGSIPLSAADDANADGQSIGALVRDATTHFSTLVRAEIELAKSEVTAEVKKGARGSIFFIIALTVLLFSTWFLFFAVAEAITWAGLPRPVAFGIVFGFMVVVAALFGLLGYLKVRKLRAPQRTISSMKEIPGALRKPHDEQPKKLEA